MDQSRNAEEANVDLKAEHQTSIEELNSLANALEEVRNELNGSHTKEKELKELVANLETQLDFSQEDFNRLKKINEDLKVC